MIHQDTIEKIHEATRVEEVIADFVDLQQKGSTLKACCPFHGEKTPSFTVSPARQTWKCFGCGKGGDAISFLRDQGKSFPDALEYLARKYNIEVRYTASKPDPQFDEKTRIRATLAAVQSHLTRTDENPALAYWSARGFEPETLETFGIGLADDGTVPLVEAAALIEAGIAAESGKLSTFGRATIPIHDARGNLVSLSGRLIKDVSDSPKYINGRETAAYRKAATLYNLHRATPHIFATGEVWIVEGYADAWALWQAEVKNVVAICGTALTDEQAALLRRFNGDKNVRFYLALDNEIGKGKTLKPSVLAAYQTALEKLLPIGEVRRVEYPNSRVKDCCDWVMSGKFDVQAAKGASKDAIEDWVSEAWTADFASNASAVEKADKQEAAASLIARVKKDSVRDIYIKSLAVTLETTPRKMEEMVKRFSESSAKSASSRDIERFDYIKVKDNYLRRLPDVDPDTKSVLWRYIPRKKDEIKQEFGSAFLNQIPRFDNYIFAPEHINYRRVVDMKIEGTDYRFFNQYEPLDYEAKPFDLPAGFYADPENFDYTTIPEIANTARLMAHLFRGENRIGRRFLTYGWDFLALLYLNPTQRLPALALVSQEEGTGKSTFLNLLGKVFGQNAVKNDAGRIGARFNSMSAGKLIVFVEETNDESRALENILKDLITATERVVEEKFGEARNVRTIEKYIFASNHEDSFLKVGTETTRFFVSKVQAIEAKDPAFEEKLWVEIPYLLHFLQKRKVITQKKDRLWFHPSELENEALLKLRQASKDVVQQNVESLLSLMFLNTEYDNPVLKITSEYLKKLMVAYGGKLYEQKTPNYFGKVLATDLRLAQSTSPARFDMLVLEAVEKFQDLATLETWTYTVRKVNGRYFTVPVWRVITPEDFATNYPRERAVSLLYELELLLKKQPDPKGQDWFEAANKLIFKSL